MAKLRYKSPPIASNYDLSQIIYYSGSIENNEVKALRSIL